MVGEKFSLHQYSVSQIIGLIRAKQFVIPEIQRPFVWKKSQVRDLIDSLFNGYPTGYIITWKNPDVKTKDGQVSSGNHVLIDGQQRITAIMAAIEGLEVLDDDFNKIKIKIAFNPQAKDDEAKFAVQDASHLKNKKWIPDISVLFDPGFSSRRREFEDKYVEENEGVDINEFSSTLTEVIDIINRQIGVIELNHSMAIDEVTEIFIRINSKGTSLSQSDFVMSKMASDYEHGGNTLRKLVDYFCHLAVKPEFYPTMIKDEDFAQSEFADKVKWLANDYDDIYDPDYADMLRVSFMLKFGRGRLADLVSLLSGRDFETREYSEEIVADSYEKIKDGFKAFINEYDFKQFVLAIRGAGYVKSKMLNSQMTLDFCYFLYLRLKEDDSIPNTSIKRYVQRWFVLSTLTGRYVGSPESVMSRDIRVINERGFEYLLNTTEESDLSDAFWNVALPQNLETSVGTNPAYHTFVAAQVYKNIDSLFMMGIKVFDLVNTAGDIHHIFPKAYLKKNGENKSSRYNQVANYIYLDTAVNKAVGEDAPSVYFNRLINQCENKNVDIGNITDIEVLKQNLKDNCIPWEVKDMDVGNYDEFLEERRKRMAQFMRDYYFSI